MPSDDEIRARVEVVKRDHASCRHATRRLANTRKISAPGVSFEECAEDRCEMARDVLHLLDERKPVTNDDVQDAIEWLNAKNKTAWESYGYKFATYWDLLIALISRLAWERNDARAEQSMPPLLAGLRAEGWMVCCHNDYRLPGKKMTFWSFAKDGREAHADGDTDEEALTRIASAVAPALLAGRAA